MLQDWWSTVESFIGSCMIDVVSISIFISRSSNSSYKSSNFSMVWTCTWTRPLTGGGVPSLRLINYLTIRKLVLVWVWQVHQNTVQKSDYPPRSCILSTILFFVFLANICSFSRFLKWWVEHKYSLDKLEYRTWYFWYKSNRWNSVQSNSLSESHNPELLSLLHLKSILHLDPSMDPRFWLLPFQVIAFFESYDRDTNNSLNLISTKNEMLIHSRRFPIVQGSQ